MKKVVDWFKTQTPGVRVLLVGSAVFWVLVFGSIIGAAVPATDDVQKVEKEEAISFTTEQEEQKELEPVVEVEEATDVQPIPFTSTTRNDANLEEGTTRTDQEGVNGERRIVYRITFTDGVETSRETVSDTSTPPVNKVVAVGTKKKSNCHPNYSPCVPNAGYDLDCSDIGFTVRVIGADPYRLDRDRDGYGCE